VESLEKQGNKREMVGGKKRDHINPRMGAKRNGLDVRERRKKGDFAMRLGASKEPSSRENARRGKRARKASFVVCSTD